MIANKEYLPGNKHLELFLYREDENNKYQLFPFIV